MTLSVSLASYILASHSHTSHASHIFTITTLSHTTISLGNSRNHLSSLIRFHFIQPKIHVIELFLISGIARRILGVQWSFDISLFFFPDNGTEG